VIAGLPMRADQPPRAMPSRGAKRSIAPPNMRDIRVEGATATARKTFNDAIAMADGGAERLNWQSIFFCSKDEGSWKITGFVGFLRFSG